jgi:hypothetical protein
MLVIGANVCLEKRRSSCLSIRIFEASGPRRICCCEVCVGARSGGGGVGEVSGGQLAISAGDAATSARSESSSSCVDAFYYEDIIPCNFSKCIVRNFIQSTVLLVVIFVAFLLDDMKLFRCVASFWLGGKFVRYLT